jgi:hypothetical protein
MTVDRIRSSIAHKGQMTQMTRSANGLRTSLLVASVLGLAGSFARADVVLQQYEFQGQAGSETTLAPSFVTAGLTGVNFIESSVLTPSAGVNSMNSSGWNLANTFYSFGFTIQAGRVVTVDRIILTSRSSATGPGFINLQASVDGGALTTVAAITQTSTSFNDEFLSITPVTAKKSLTFFFVTANQTAANGGTIGSAGTFRIGDYNPAGTPTPFTINGTISAAAAVPEPSAVVLAAFGLAAVGLAARLRARV